MTIPFLYYYFDVRAKGSSRSKTGLKIQNLYLVNVPLLSLRSDEDEGVLFTFVSGARTHGTLSGGGWKRAGNRIWERKLGFPFSFPLWKRKMFLRMSVVVGPGPGLGSEPKEEA